MKLTIRRNTISTTQVAYLCTHIRVEILDGDYGDYGSPVTILQRFCPGKGLDVTEVESTTNVMTVSFRGFGTYTGAEFVADYQEVV